MCQSGYSGDGLTCDGKQNHDTSIKCFLLVYQILMNASMAWTTVLIMLCASILFRVFLACVGLAILEME